MGDILNAHWSIWFQQIVKKNWARTTKKLVVNVVTERTRLKGKIKIPNPNLRTNPTQVMVRKIRSGESKVKRGKFWAGKFMKIQKNNLIFWNEIALGNILSFSNLTFWFSFHNFRNFLKFYSSFSAKKIPENRRNDE